MKLRKGKQIPMESILKMTKELSPDDIEVGKTLDLTSMVEEKDDYSPDDTILPNPKVTRLGKRTDEK